MSAAALSYFLLVHGAPQAGYTAGILTGVYVFSAIAHIVSGIYGQGGPRANPIGPLAWILSSVAVVVAGYNARRERKDSS